MSTKAARGIKRTCQSNECGARYYDLNRDPIACPICGTIYLIAHSAVPITAAMIDEKPRKAKKELVTDKELAPEAAAEGDEALVDIEEAEDIPADDDETFLEAEEEEGGDVSNIIGGPVAEGEEEV